MNPDTPSFTYFSSCHLSRAGPGAELSVVWLGGEHDIATKDELAAIVAEAIALDEPALVIDLSGVHFISAATIGVIVDANEFLARRERSLVLRAAPPLVRRVFEACGLSDLVDRESSAIAIQTVNGAAALGSWVKVPATGRVDWPDISVTAEPKIAEQVSVESARAERPLFVRIP